MIGVGIACIVLGLVLLFVSPWAGIAVESVGLVLAVFWVAGFNRRGVAGDPRSGRRRA